MHPYWRRFVVPYAAVLTGMLVLDAVWLGFIARDFYARKLGYLMAPSVQWWAAGLFYLLYAAGVTAFVVRPAAASASMGATFGRGAFFGLVAYGTYDLTSQAVVRDWPLIVTVADLAWGAFLTGILALAGVGAARARERRAG